MLQFFRQYAALLVLGTVTASLAVAAAAAYAMRGQAAGPKPTVDTAREFIARQQPAAALTVARTLDPTSPEVIAVEIEATTQQRNVFSLAALYDQHPEEVAKQDDAAQLVARSALMTGDDETIDDLIAQWEGDSDEPHAWLCMKADRALREGDFDLAREVLESQTFTGQRDAGRQIRLAMLDAADSPAAALDRINALVRSAPRSGDAHLMRAQLLEGLGRLPEARVAFVTALAAVPENPFYRYELASFYRRRGDLRFAMRTWEDSLELTAPEPGWLKTLFWSRVAHPTERTIEDADSLQGNLAVLVGFLNDLPADRFFDAAAFKMLPSARTITRRHQEIYWLKVLEELRLGRDAEALSLLQNDRFREQSWNAILEDSLRSLLAFRLGGTLDRRTPRSFGGDDPNKLHPFIAALIPAEGSPLDPRLAAFLKTPDAIPMTLVACGWMEAALRMPHSPKCLDDAPHHMAYAMTQAYRSNRSAEAAFSFAMRQPESSALDAVLGEMHLARGEADEAMQMWRLAARDVGPAGYRASWMLAVELLGRGRLNEAERTVNDHADLRSAVIGQELLARIALQRGEVETAVAIYDAIANDSIDARLFAIQRRVARGTATDLQEAQAIGEQLFAVHPDIPSVRRLVLQLNDLNNAR